MHPFRQWWIPGAIILGIACVEFGIAEVGLIIGGAILVGWFIVSINS